MGTLDVSLLLDIPYTNRFMFIHGCTEAPKHQAEARIPDSCAPVPTDVLTASPVPALGLWVMNENTHMRQFGFCA